MCENWLHGEPPMKNNCQNHRLGGRGGWASFNNLGEWGNVSHFMKTVVLVDKLWSGSWPEEINDGLTGKQAGCHVQLHNWSDPQWITGNFPLIITILTELFRSRIPEATLPFTPKRHLLITSRSGKIKPSWISLPELHKYRNFWDYKCFQCIQGRGL